MRGGIGRGRMSYDGRAACKEYLIIYEQNIAGERFSFTHTFAFS